MASPLKKKAKTQGTPTDFAALVEAADTPEKLIYLMEDVQALSPEITKQIKAKLKLPFCEWSYERALKYFKIKEPVKYKPSQIPYMPAALLAKITDRLEDDFVFGGPYDVGNELRRNMTVNAVLSPIGRMFGGTIRAEYEGALSSLVASGRGEFVLYALEEIVMYIVEAKTDNFPQGTAQLMMEFYAADVMNRSANTRIPICGAVTTGAIWQFFEYNGANPDPAQRLRRSKVFSLFHNDVPSITRISSILCHAFLKTYLDSCTALHSAWGQEARANQDFPLEWNNAVKERYDVHVDDTVTFAYNKHHEVTLQAGVVAHVTIVKTNTAPNKFTTVVKFTAVGEFALVCPNHYNQSLVVCVENPRQDLAAALTRRTDANNAFQAITTAASTDVAANAFQAFNNSVLAYPV